MRVEWFGYLEEGVETRKIPITISNRLLCVVEIVYKRRVTLDECLSLQETNTHGMSLPIITRRCHQKNSEWWRQTLEQKQTIILNFEPWEWLQHSSMDRLSPAPFQNGTDCRLLQLIQPHQRDTARSWMPYQPTCGRVGSRLSCIHLSSTLLAV